MPLTAKGETILGSMQKEYGAKRGKSVFYASINSGRITGAERGGARKRSRPRTVLDQGAQ